MPTLQDLTDRVREVASRHPDLSRPVVLDLGQDGVIRLANALVDNDDASADCRISLSADDLRSLIDGQMDATMAYMTGQLRLEGDMTLALQLAQALRGG